VRVPVNITGNTRLAQKQNYVYHYNAIPYPLEWLDTIDNKDAFSWDMKLCGIVRTDVSEENFVSIFRVEKSASEKSVSSC
jgi:hypothetical protein